MSGEVCKFCDNRLIGKEQSFELCPECQIAEEESLDASDLARFRAMFPVVMPDALHIPAVVTVTQSPG